MQIFVKNLEGKSMTFDVTSTMKISEVKSLVRNRVGFSDGVSIRLTFCSKDLSNEASTLADY
jgi:hypothetical protein